MIGWNQLRFTATTPEKGPFFLVLIINNVIIEPGFNGFTMRTREQRMLVFTTVYLM
jgi:hypothetical protein